MKCPRICALYLCLLMGLLGGCSLLRAHHAGWKRPILREVGRFLSLVGIMAATSLLVPTGPVKATEALGLCSGRLRQQPLPRPSAFFNPQPRLCSSKCHLRPGPVLPSQAFFCLSKHPHCPRHVLCIPASVLCFPRGAAPSCLCWGIRRHVPEASSPCGLVQDGLGKLSRGDRDASSSRCV